jgi:hypothetical protein
MSRIALVNIGVLEPLWHSFYNTISKAALVNLSVLEPLWQEIGM